MPSVDDDVDDVVRGAAEPERAVGPGDVGAAVRADGRGRQRRCAQAEVRSVVGRRDPELRRPGRAAVVGAERGDLALVVVGDHDATARQHEWLHAGRERATDRLAPGEARRARQARPGAAAVARGLRDHLLADRVAVAEVAVAVVGALRPVVAGDPLLVLSELRAGRDGGHRRAPVMRVGRAVDRDLRADAAEDERDREPGLVPPVVRDRRVARSRPQPRQEAAPPGAAAVVRDRVADVARAAVEDPPDLEDRDDRLAEGGRVGLDLGLVLALAVLVRVARGLARHYLAVAGDAVGAVDGGEVVAAAAGDEVADAVHGLQPVGPLRAVDARRRRHRDDDQREGEGDEERPLQREPSPFSASRNG